jgi:4a-hydroxytetrahydrobiopterin dehydratase
MDLAEQRCEPSQIGGSPMPRDEAEKLARQVPEWKLDDKEIHREVRFKDFREAIDFVLKVADIAEERGHHPDITISYNVVKLSLMTHKVGGLTRNDFILAAKIDRLIGGRVKEAV